MAVALRDGVGGAVERGVERQRRREFLAIIYPVTKVPERLKTFYFLNPMAGIIEAYRAVLLNNELPGSYLAPTALIAVVIFCLGYWFFKSVEFRFADIV